MVFLAIATLGAWLTFYLFAAAIAPYGGQNIEVFRFFIYGPGPGWFILLTWWLVSVSLRVYSFVVASEKDKMLAQRINNIVILMLVGLVGLEIAIVIDYRDIWF